MAASALRDVPSIDPAALRRLAGDLAAFTVDAVDEAMGEMAAGALRRDDPVPARRVLRDRRDAAAVLSRLWLLGDPVTRRDLDGRGRAARLGARRRP